MESPSPAALFSVLEQMQHHHLTRALQGLLPPIVNAQKLREVLDLNCNSGCWAIDLALAYPGVTVTGLHANPEIIAQARQSALAGGLARVRFYEADLQKPLNLASHTFDLVHAFMSHPVLRPPEWPAFLAECMRVMKPGATINLVNLALGPASSTAYLQLLVFSEKVAQAMGYSFLKSIHSPRPGIYFPHLLRQAGFVQDSYLIRPVNLGGWNNATGRACCQRFLSTVHYVKSWILAHNELDETEFERLFAQAQKDIVEVDFCATGVLISAFATKK